MKQEYFMYNNKRYGPGTIIIINKFDNFSKINNKKEAMFCYYLRNNDSYVIKMDNITFCYTTEKFYNMLIDVTDRVDVEYVNLLMKRQKLNNKSPTFSDELNVDCMFIAWIWYVFIMVVAIIFKDRIAIWIFASIVFFNYRNKKLQGGN